jgi:hypothetical protein
MGKKIQSHGTFSGNCRPYLNFGKIQNASRKLKENIWSVIKILREFQKKVYIFLAVLRHF